MSRRAHSVGCGVENGFHRQGDGAWFRLNDGRVFDRFIPAASGFWKSLKFRSDRWPIMALDDIRRES
jgi:hypothetical protein